MFWGQAWSSIFGDTDDVMRIFDIAPIGLGFRVRFGPKSGYGERWYGLYLDGKLINKFYVMEGQVVTTVVDSGDSTMLRIEDLGHWGSDSRYNPRFVAEALCSNTPRFTCEWSSLPIQVIQGNGLSDPAITGVDRFTNLGRAMQGNDFGQLVAQIADDGISDPVLVLWAGQVLVATGAYNSLTSTFTLTPHGLSEITGTVTYIPSTPVGNQACSVIFRWPDKWRVYYQDHPFDGSFDPDVYQAQFDDPVKSTIAYTSPDLDPATYYIRILAVNSDGIVDDVTASELSIEIPVFPEPPTELQYVSGDALATIVKFKPSHPQGKFEALGVTGTDQWSGIAAAPNGDVYACTLYTGIYKQTGGTGPFQNIGAGNRFWSNITAAPNGDIFATVAQYSGSPAAPGAIYKQTGGVGSFDLYCADDRNWSCITVAPNGDIYAGINAGQMYVQTGGVGSFNLIFGSLSAQYQGLAAAPNGDIYTTLWSIPSHRGIYKRTGGVGAFVKEVDNPDVTYLRGVTVHGDNVYVQSSAGDIYVKYAGTELYVALGETSRYWCGLGSNSAGIYACTTQEDLYKKTPHAYAYRLYANDEVNGPVNTKDIIDTSSDDGEYISMTLDEAPKTIFKTDGNPSGQIELYTGQRKVIVRAFYIHEELNMDQLLINYDASGEVVTLPPNTCSIERLSAESTTTPGMLRRIFVDVAYSAAEEYSPATSARLYAWLLGDDQPETYIDEVTLKEGAILQYATMSGEVDALGTYNIAVEAVNEDGVAGPRSTQLFNLTLGPEDAVNLRVRNG